MAMGTRNIRKRVLIHAGGSNLGLLMRTLIGVGTPRGLQGRLATALAALLVLMHGLWAPMRRPDRLGRPTSPRGLRSTAIHVRVPGGMGELAFTTGC